MKRFALVLSLLLTLFCVDARAVTPGGAAVGTQFGSMTLGDATLCTASVTAGTLNFRRVGNIVTAFFGGPFLQCTLTVGATVMAWTQLVPTQFRPAGGTACLMMFGDSTVYSTANAFIVHMQFQGNGQIVSQVVLPAGAKTVWNSTNDASGCTYPIR